VLDIGAVTRDRPYRLKQAPLRGIAFGAFGVL